MHLLMTSKSRLKKNALRIMQVFIADREQNWLFSDINTVIVIVLC